MLVWIFSYSTLTFNLSFKVLSESSHMFIMALLTRKQLPVSQRLGVDNWLKYQDQIVCQSDTNVCTCIWVIDRV